MNKIKELLFYFLFVIVCGIVMYVGISSIIDNKSYLDKAEKTTGTIVEIRNEQPTIEIVINNKKYQSKIGEYSSTMKIGDKKEVYYNPSDPSDIRAKSTSYYGYILIIIGVLFELVLIWRIIKTFKYMKEGNV